MNKLKCCRYWTRNLQLDYKTNNNEGNMWVLQNLTLKYCTIYTKKEEISSLKYPFLLKHLVCTFITKLFTPNWHKLHLHCVFSTTSKMQFLQVFASCTSSIFFKSKRWQCCQEWTAVWRDSCCLNLDFDSTPMLYFLPGRPQSGQLVQRALPWVTR